MRIQELFQKSFHKFRVVMTTGCGYRLELDAIFCRPSDRSHQVSLWSYRDSCWYPVEAFWPEAGMQYFAKDPPWIWRLRSSPVLLLCKIVIDLVQNWNVILSQSWDGSLLTHAVATSDSKWKQSFMLYKPGLWNVDFFFYCGCVLRSTFDYCEKV